jgi:hypothetical protein
MKKIAILLVLVIAAATGFTQSLDDIREQIVKKDFTGARTAIDKYLADPKNADKADAWYFKGFAYNALSNEKTTPAAEALKLKSDAFEAFKKNQQLDAKDTRLKLEGYNSYLDLYFSLYDLGANAFNNKDYEGAYNAFQKALEVKDYALSKQYTYTQATLHPLDTSLVLNTAIAATQAKKTDEAVGYYKKLIDANIAGENYREVYEYLAEYYNNKGDQAALADILAKGKKHYPTNSFWDELELSKVSKGGDQKALFAKYDELLAKNPANFYLAYNYAVELHNKINKEADATGDNATKQRLYEVLKLAVAADTGIDATVLMANHLYNMYVENSNAATMVKGTKPDDVKKKNDLKATAAKKMDECIVYAEKAVAYFDARIATLKASPKANYKIILDYLSELYKAKGDTKKSLEYDKKRVAI